MHKIVKMSWDGVPSISLKGTSYRGTPNTYPHNPHTLTPHTCLLAPLPNRLPVRLDEGREKVFLPAPRNQVVNVPLTDLSLSSETRSNTWPWEQRVWKQEREERSLASSEPDCVNQLGLWEKKNASLSSCLTKKETEDWEKNFIPYNVPKLLPLKVIFYLKKITKYNWSHN